MLDHPEYIKFKGSLYRSVLADIPKPRKYTEEDLIPESVVLEAKAGDVRARNRVVVSYLPFIKDRIKKYKLVEDDRETLKQECLLAIVRAIDTWRPETGKPFASFVYFAIWKTATRFMNRIQGRGESGKLKRRKMVYLDEPMGEEGAAARHEILPSLDPTPETTFGDQESDVIMAKIVQYIQNMPGAYGDIARDGLLGHKTPEQIEQARGIPATTVRRWLKEAREKIIKDLGPLLEEAKIRLREKELEPDVITPPTTRLRHPSAE